MDTKMVESINKINKAKKYNKAFNDVMLAIKRLDLLVESESDILSFDAGFSINDGKTRKFLTGRNYVYGDYRDLLEILGVMKQLVFESKNKDGFVNI